MIDEREMIHPDDEEEEFEEEHEWEPGQCDHCWGLPAGAEPGLLSPGCACLLGQGADPNECSCGPED
ncbi:hypothetical protein [Streptomyces sp. NPDC056264]|uniref:hypothetical protein n=1 Tax=Streptomyces sp. NPDC056264 TaxID=3345767 RepID=UPI003AAAA2B2